MKIKDLFENWKLTGLKINAFFGEMEWKPSDPDKAAAWDLYIELLTRITTQPLPDEDGVEQTALASIHNQYQFLFTPFAAAVSVLLGKMR